MIDTTCSFETDHNEVCGEAETQRVVGTHTVPMGLLSARTKTQQIDAHLCWRHLSEALRTATNVRVLQGV